MAIQTSDITFSGKLGAQVHYKRNGKNYTRKAAKAYDLSAGSQKASTEFGAASSAGALIRKGFASFITRVNRERDQGFVNRLNAKMVQIISMGPAAMKGSRKVIDGDVALLSGTELNPFTGLGSLFLVSPEITVDPVNGVCIALPSFTPEAAFPRKYHTSRFAVISVMCCSFDFPNKNGRMSIAEDLVLPVEGAAFPGGMLEFPLDTEEERVLIVGIMLYFRTNDGAPLQNRKYMAADLVKAALVRDGKIVPFIYPEKEAPVPEAVRPVAKVSWQLKQST